MIYDIITIVIVIAAFAFAFLIIIKAFQRKNTNCTGCDSSCESDKHLKLN